MHNWRVKFNSDDIGYGYDQSRPEEKHHYPEAYAVFGRGYLKLYQATKNEEYLECAHKCYDWLMKNPSPSYSNLSWGLPWEWKEWNAPKDLSYLVTTSFVGHFFKEFSKYGEVDEELTSIKDWIILENGYFENSTGILFYYANHESLKFKILNPSVLATSYLFNILNDHQEVKSLVRKSLDYIYHNQNKNGSWYYSEKNRVIDNFHTTLIIESLIDMGEKNYQIKRALQYYYNNFFISTGQSRDIALQIRQRRNILKAWINYKEQLKNIENEARLWSYGGALRILCKSYYQKHNEFSEQVYQYLMKNLQNTDGSFKYKSNNLSLFVRNEAHIFDGLTSMLE